jgi:hypothetical protein
MPFAVLFMASGAIIVQSLVDEPITIFLVFVVEPISIISIESAHGILTPSSVSYFRAFHISVYMLWLLFGSLTPFKVVSEYQLFLSETFFQLKLSKFVL